MGAVLWLHKGVKLTRILPMLRKDNIFIIASLCVLLGIGGVLFFIQKGDTVSDNKLSSEEGDRNNPQESTSGGVEKVGELIFPRPSLSREIPPSATELVKTKIEELSLAVQKEESFNVWLDLASYRKIAGDVEGAKEIWIYMTNIYPFEIAPHINLGDVYHFNEKNYLEAEKEYKKAIAINRGYFPTYLNLHQLYRYSYAEKKDLADDILLTGLSISPSELPLLATLGEYYEEMGDIDMAIEYYTKTADEAQLIGDTDTRTRYLEKVSNLENK